VDNGDHLPSDEGEKVDEDNDTWIAVPNGHYKVTVHAIAWHEEPGADDKPFDERLPSYIVRFQAVANISEVAPASAPPRLAPLLTAKAMQQDPWAPWSVEPATDIKLHDSYPLLISSEMPVVAGQQQALAVDQKTYDWYIKLREKDMKAWKQAMEKGLPSDLDPYTKLALAESNKCPCPGSLVKVHGADGGKGSWNLRVGCVAPVTVTGAKKEKTGTKATVVPFTRPAEPASDQQFQELRAAFAGHAREDAKFRKHAPAADFEADRAAAITQVNLLLDMLLTKLKLPKNTLAKLAVASDKERATILLEFLRAAK
jgi:hypothetical protein